MKDTVVIKGCQLLEPIGEGAYGAVYRAHQETVDREVAVKIIRPEFANQPEFIRRFETEAHLVAQLEHLHIVPLYDYWRDPEGAYLVMRLMKGGSLAEMLADGPPSLGQALRLVDQLASALHAAHQQGVVHRDLKPANILLDESGNAYLSDFGVAKRLLSESDEGEAIAGTPAYLSPEQVRGQPVTPTADLYSLGVLLYELLTGQHPFPRSSSEELVHQHLHASLPSVREVRPDLPAGIDKVIQKATAKDPADRYPDALTLATAFRLALDPDSSAAAEALRMEGLEVPNPYKGLRAFQEGDAADFFGREALTGQLLARMLGVGETEHFLAVVGPSGSGKSSVVRAGLLPALRQGALPGSERWLVAEMLPGTHPLEELEEALLRVAVNPPRDLFLRLAKNERGLREVIPTLLPGEGYELLLFIDQFEELYSLVAKDADRVHFLDSLQTAVTAPDSGLRVVVTLRADFYDRPLEHPGIGALFRQHLETVLPLSLEEIERAICGPAERVGASLEPGLVAAILEDVSEQPGALPLLQYALTELFERREGSLLTLKAYQDIGGVQGALSRRAEEIYQGLTSDQMETTRQLFLRLVTLGEGVEDTRRRVLRSEIVGLFGKNGVVSTDNGAEAGRPRHQEAPVDAVLEAFGQARLLTFDHDPATRTPTLEVAHEALLREWSRLREWLDESRADLRMQRVLSNATGDWAANERDPSFLLRGSRLDQYAAWMDATPLALTRTEQAYLTASMADEAARQAQRERLERRSRNFLRALVGVFAVATLVAVGLSIFAFQQRRASQEQTAVLLAGQAETELANGYHDRAVLLALTALEEFPYTVQAEHALGQAVSYSRALQVYEGHTNSVTSAAWSPDGSRIATSGGLENRIKIWDAATSELLLVLDMPAGITGNLVDMALHVQWTPDGQRLQVVTGDRFWLGSQDYDLLIWDAATGEQISSVEIANQAEPESGEMAASPRNYVTSAAAEIAPRTGGLATLGGDNTAIVWDAGWQKPALQLKGHADAVNSVDWSADESMLVTASLDGTAMIWDARSGQVLHTLKGHEGGLNLALWSPDGSTIATAGEDGILRIWDAKDGALLNSIETISGEISSLVWAPNSLRLISGHWDGSLRIWEVPAGKLLVTLRGHEGMVSDLQWSPVDDQLVSVDDNGGLRIWNAAPSTAWRLFPPQAETGENWTIQGGDWSSDGRYLALGGGDLFDYTDPPLFAIWDVWKNELVMENLGDMFNYYAIFTYFSPDDQAILYTGTVGFPDFDGLESAHVFDARSGELLRTFTPDGETLVRSIAWSPDGSQVATGMFFFGGLANWIIIWDYETGEQITSFEHSSVEDVGVNYLEWSPDGSKLASTSDDHTTRVWDAKTWELLYTLQHEEPTFAWVTAWSPDGTRLLTTTGNDEEGAKDNTGRVWDGETGKELLVFRGHTKSLSEGSWSPDGSRIATFGNDGAVRIWDSSTGDEYLTLTVPALFGGSAFWSPDGEHLGVIGNETLISVWRVWQSTEELVDYAHDCCVIRELTAAERQQFGLPAGE